METSLSQFYNDLKTNTAPISPTTSFNNDMTCDTWRAKACKCRDQLTDDCHRELIVKMYCKILPFDDEFKHGHHGMICQDVDTMLQNKGMTPTQYMTSCSESTKNPTLGFYIRSVNKIGDMYMKEADEKIKDAKENDIALPDPEADVHDPNIQNALVDIETDGSSQSFMNELINQTKRAIVDNVSKEINQVVQSDNMEFQTVESSNNFALALEYVQKKLLKENKELSEEQQDEMIGMAIREATLNYMDQFFRQPGATLREYATRVRFGKGNVVSESAVTKFVESV